MGLFSNIQKILKSILPSTKVEGISVTKSTPTARHLGSRSFVYRLSEQVQKIFTRKPKTINPEDLIQNTKQLQQEEIKQAIKKARQNLDEEAGSKIRKSFYQTSGKSRTGSALAQAAIESDEIPKKSDIILQELLRRLDRWEADVDESTAIAHRIQTLKARIQIEIEMYGRDKVAYSCEQAGHLIITNAETYVFASSDEKRRDAFMWFDILISGGEAPTPERVKQLGELMEEHEYNPFEDEQ